MRAKTVFVLFLWTVTSSRAFLSGENEIEARGKKKKIALFVYFADIIIKKLFVLKLIYAFVFWVVLHKAGYFLAWFASYFKEKKKEFYHESHHHHPHYEYGPPQFGPQHYGSEYGPPQFGPQHYGSEYGPPQFGPQHYGSEYGPYKRQN